MALDGESAPEPELIRIVVDLGLTGEVLAIVSLRPTDTILNLRLAAQEASGQKPLRLIFDNLVLQDVDVVSSCGIFDNNHVLATIVPSIDPHAWKDGGHEQAMLPVKTDYEDGDFLACHDNGDTLVSAGSTTSRDHVGVWSARQGSSICSLEGHTRPLLSVAVQGDVIASGGEDKTIRLWSLSAQRCTATLSGHGNSVHSLAISGDYLVSGSADQSVKQWSLSRLECMTTLLEHQGKVYTVTANDSVAASGGNGSCGVKVWPLGGTKSRHTLTSSNISTVYALSAFEDLLAVGGGQGVEIWSLEGATMLRKISDKLTSSLSLYGGVLAIGFWLANGERIEVWSLEDENPAALVTTLQGKPSTQTDVIISPSGFVAALNTAEPSGITVWHPDA